MTKEAGLDRVWMTMGSNFADIDNDGFLDMYLGTGLTSYSALVPNVMLKNVDGVSFTDVTVATGTGHLQKGHGVSFADWDGDGDLDLFVETGGSVPGDRAYNSLFQNPGKPAALVVTEAGGNPEQQVGVRCPSLRASASGRTASVAPYVASSAVARASVATV